MARNRAIDAVRHEESHRQRERAWSESGGVEPDTAPGADDTVLEKEIRMIRRRLVRRAMTQLPRHQRQALHMAYFEGKSIPRIAAEQALPLGTVKSRVRMGGKRLRTMLTVLDDMDLAPAG
jgi:RNA polymerase sigma-70 factor (ECF subfamily)